MFQLNEEESVSTHQNYCHITVIQEHWRLAIFVFISKFLRPPVAKELHRVLCLIFEVERFKRKFFSIFSISSIIYFGTTDVRHKWTILDKANVLKTIILPSKVKFLMRQILRTLWMFDIAVKKFFSMLSLLLYEKWIPRILMVFTFKLTHFIPQTATWSPFRGPIPEISHLEKFGLRPEDIFSDF